MQQSVQTCHRTATHEHNTYVHNKNITHTSRRLFRQRAPLPLGNAPFFRKYDPVLGNMIRYKIHTPSHPPHSHTLYETRFPFGETHTAFRETWPSLLRRHDSLFEKRDPVFWGNTTTVRNSDSLLTFSLSWVVCATTEVASPPSRNCSCGGDGFLVTAPFSVLTQVNFLFRKCAPLTLGNTTLFQETGPLFRKRNPFFGNTTLFLENTTRFQETWLPFMKQDPLWGNFTRFLRNVTLLWGEAQLPSEIMTLFLISGRVRKHWNFFCHAISLKFIWRRPMLLYYCFFDVLSANEISK